MAKTDSELMILAGNGDKPAFDELMHRHQQSLARWVWAMVGDEEEAWDVVQDAFFQAYRHRDRFNPSLNFKTWLFAIARNISISFLRRRGRRVFTPMSTLTREGLDDDSAWGSLLADESPGPREKAAASERAEWLRMALERLDDSHREVLQLKYFAGLKSREIADLMGLEVGTVWSRVHHGIKKLKALAEEVGFHG